MFCFAVPMKKHTRVSTIRSRVAAGAIAAAASVGLVLGTAVPAQAAIWHYVSSSWVEAYAGATSNTNNDGWIQAFAQLGGDVSWGVARTSHSDAKVNGFNMTHKARIYRNSVIIAQS